MGASSDKKSAFGTTPFSIALAKTDPSKGFSGISAFLVDADLPGVFYGREGDLVGLRFGCRNEVRLDNVKVHKDKMVGGLGEGLMVMVDGVNDCYSWYCYQSVGAAECAMEEIMEYVKKTVRFGSHLYEFQGIHYPIAEMAINSETGRAIAHKAAALRDEGDPAATIMGTIAFRFCGPMAVGVTSKALELLAGRGVERGEGHCVEQLWRETTIYNLYRTANMDKRFIASHYLGKKLKAGIVK